MKKRFLSLVLVVLMILAVVPVSAYAASGINFKLRYYYFNPDGEQMYEEVTANTKIVHDVLSSAAYIRAGYTFVNWNSKADGSGQYSFKDGKQIGWGQLSDMQKTADKSGGLGYYPLYMISTPNTDTPYTVNHIRLNANGEAVRTETYTFTGTTDTMTAVEARNIPGYAARDVEQVLITGDGKAVVNVYYDIKQYTLKVNLRGGTLESDYPLTQNLYYGLKIKLPSETPTKEGYTFKNWRFKTDSSSWSNTIPERMPAENARIEATWNVNTYIVAFDGNGGKGSMESKYYTYDKVHQLPMNTFTKAGYTFTGWTFGEKTFADGGEIKNLSAVNHETVTLVAKWTPNNYKVVFNANGGSGNMDDVARAYDDKKPLPECDFTREGYTFAGWGKNKDNTPDSATTWQPGQIKNLASIEGSVYILYAIWEPNTCTVNFNANGGEGTMAPQTYTYDEDQTLTLNAFTKTGYDFIGWALTADATAPDYTDGQNVCNFTTEDGAEVNLYAVWEQIDYTVTLNTNGGIVNSGNVTGYTIETGATLPTNVTKDGYTFEGWYGNEALTGDAVAKIEVGTTGDKVFWAKWTSNDTDVISVVYEGDTASRENDTFKFVRDDRDLPNDGTLFIITLSDSKAKVVEGPVSEDGGLTWTFLVESESGNHKEYTIKFVIPALHKITVINGTASQDEGFIGNIIDIDADDIIGGKQFIYWEVESEGEVVFIGGKASEITSFIMPDADVTVTAVYRAVLPMFMHSIIVVDSDYGTTSPTGIMLVMQGLSHKFTFTPDAGCEIVDVLINGESVGAVDSYRLTVNEFVNTVEAIYAPIVDGE